MPTSPLLDDRTAASEAPLYGTSTDARSRVEVLGVAIDNLGFDEAIALLRELVRAPEPRSLFFVNAHTLDLASRSPEFRRLLNDGDWVFGDGTGVRWAARLQHVRMKANLNGTDLIPAFMAAADGDGLRYYLLGATPEVLARTVAEMQRRFPGWSLAGHHHGFLDVAATERVIGEIAASRPHLLLVAMGNPLQERWIAAHRHRLAASLCVGVGGLFSYLTGDYRRAPRLLRRGGLEWLAVLFTQRQKWRRYVVGAPRFLSAVVGERVAAARREGRR